MVFFFFFLFLFSSFCYLAAGHHHRRPLVKWMRGSCVRANQLEKERTINWDHQLREEGLLLSVGPRVWLPVLSNGMKAIAHLSNLIQFFFFCLRYPPQLPSRGECTDDDDWLIFCQPPINNKFLLFAFAVQPPFLLSSPIRKDRKRVEPDHWRVWPVSFSKSPPFHPSQRNWCGYGFPWPANSLESLPSSLRNNRTRWLKGSAATWKENNRGGRSRDPLGKKNVVDFGIARWRPRPWRI